VRIGEPARKHGIADEDILHAVAHVVVFIATDEGFTMLAGPARNGTLLEIGVLDIDGDDPVVIHADDLRPKFYQYL
jgi:hypothetical protein